MLVNGSKIANHIKKELKKKIRKLKVKPGLGIILVGRDKPSQTFVAQKIRFCKEAGISVGLALIREDAKYLTKEIKKNILKFNGSKSINGIIIQLPLPKTLKTLQDEIFQLIEPGKDIDCFNPTNLGLLNFGGNVILPAVVRACLEILNIYKISLQGKTVLVVGWGQVVGKPLVPALLQKGTTVIVCNEYTKNLGNLSRQADVIISAAGKPKIINGKMTKKGAVAIDVGYSVSNGKICGDFDFETMRRKTRIITPVPGGIGPITVAMVAKNVLESYQRQT